MGKPNERQSSRNEDSKSKREREFRAAAAAADTFPIVGLGASAGGLGALEAFFENVPSDSGLAFVVVTHQHPKSRSLMAELLARKTSMPVVEVRSATHVEPNHVYTLQPGYNLGIENGVLQPAPAAARPQPQMPVDYFFRSLAHDQKERAVGIVLSGTGSDGSLGLKEIKGELGMVMVQDETSAEYSGMPHAAIATEVVDYVLPAAEMPRQLLTYVAASMPGRQHSVPSDTLPDVLQQIFLAIRERTGHDFSRYKRSTVWRRIERRMNVHHLDTLNKYVRYLKKHPAEVDSLFKELLIGVTSFFRDDEAWQALAQPLRELLSDKPNEYVLRAWIPGCSTGEEAYSLAILLRECLDELKKPFNVQIFATDLDMTAIDVARAGVYPLGISNDISAQRLARFFTLDDDSYRVRKEIRDMIVFAPQNLIADPPFTKLDILSCRNLLIYLDASLQRRLLPIFHYALKPKGLLFLGSSESIGSYLELFANVDKKWKLFRRNDVSTNAYAAEFPAGTPQLAAIGPPQVAPAQRSEGSPSLENVVDRMLLRELVPPTVLVHERGGVVHVHGRTGLFLEPAQGAQASANIFNMARRGLEIRLSAAIRQAATGKEVLQRGVRVQANGDSVSVDLRVVRLEEPEALRGLYRITFEHVQPVSDDHTRGGDEAEPPSRIVELERELQYMKANHQSTIEELETANEELKSTNEELQSTNEELQSANEELETSKEEMQSLNEELQTVNAELQGKVDDLSRANNDMKNLLNGTDIATIFLDGNLRIKRFTEQAKKVIRLIPTDIGRPIGDLVSTLHYGRLVDDAREVLRTLVFKETEVQGEKQEWYLMRILPYRTTENVINGLVLTFVDVSKLKYLQNEQTRMLDALRSSPVSVFAQDLESRFTWVYSAAFGKGGPELVGKLESELFQPDEARQLAQLRQHVLATRAASRQQIQLAWNGTRRNYDFYVEPRHEPTGEITGFTFVVTDVTGSASE